MIELFVDGASAGNPGLSGIGIFIRGEGHLIQLSEPIQPTNNHIAEFTALIRGLQEVKKLGANFVAAKSDSKIVVSSIEKNYVKNPLYQPLLKEAMDIIQNFDMFYITWLPDAQNKAADHLARKAIQAQKS
ncbi:ribonuclease H [Lysinibacillus alkalisoli]|uniref:Ribonuclease H n=1 Tax=Lysinibacillus alkalisoli TaxID=1911548 RepID=A0A917LFS2_9BACI|nr:ribonuclease HI family protein [Lysinibacillus alkalisoli]GGG19016.1 ribonuclease H [Lysinibacillus alkalisoli]